MRFRSLAITLAACCIVGWACGSQRMPSGPSTLAITDEPLRPGDALRITFSAERELSGEFPIDENQRSALPLIGEVGVEGMGGGVLRDSLVRAYGRHVRNQTVQVTLLRRVRVLGEVQRPGIYHVDPTMALVDAIALAGGPTAQGRLDDIDIIRDGRVVAANVGTNDLVGSYVRSGDQIMVPKTSWLSRNAAWVIGGTVSTAAIIVTAIVSGD